MMPSQHGVHDYLAAAPQFHNQDWLAGLPTLPQLLADAGYACGFSGKWHLGRDEMVQPGFEDWFALSGDYPIPHKGAYRYSDNGWITTLNGYMTQHIADRTVEFLRRQRADRRSFISPGSMRPIPLGPISRTVWCPPTGPAVLQTSRKRR